VPPADEGPATLDLVLPDAGPPAPFRLQVAGPILTITGDLPPDLAVSLVRAPGEPIPVPSVAVAGGLQVDLASLTLAEPWAVEGEWSLLLRRADGSTWSRRSQAVLVPGADPTWSLSAVIPTVLGSGPDRVLALDLWGTSLPRGAELRLVAEDGRRLLPLPEPQADGEDHIVRRFAITDLEANDLDLRILAGGSWVQGPSLHWDGQRALVRPAGRVDTSPGPVGWVLQPTTAPDTPPGGVPLTGELRGCSCQTDGPSPPGADLASVLLLPLARRRRAQTRPRLRRTSDITRL
jgi:MYXO-CTERM domain-containing protein